MSTRSQNMVSYVTAVQRPEGCLVTLRSRIIAHFCDEQKKSVQRHKRLHRDRKLNLRHAGNTDPAPPRGNNETLTVQRNDRPWRRIPLGLFLNESPAVCRQHLPIMPLYKQNGGLKVKTAGTRRQYITFSLNNAVQVIMVSPRGE